MVFMIFMFFAYAIALFWETGKVLFGGKDEFFK